MERNTFFCNLGLYIKSVLVFILLLGGSGSAWADELTICDNSNTNSYVPFYGYNINIPAANSQFIIPNTKISGLSNSQIEKITFYGNSAKDTNWGNAEFDIFITEVSTTRTVFTSTTYDNWEEMSLVYCGVLSYEGASKSLVITLKNPYEYSGGNLLIGIKQTKAGSNNSFSWYGETQTGNTAIRNSSGAATGNASFLPKMKFTYSTASTHKKPKNFVTSNFTSSSVTLKWLNGNDESNWQIVYSKDSNFNPDTASPIDVENNPYTLTGLNLGTTYYTYIRSNYGNNIYSNWTFGRFTPVSSKDIIVNNGTSTNANTIIHNATHYGTKTQYVIPASKLTGIKNRQITKLTFYGYGSSSSVKNVSWPDAKFDVYLNEVPEDKSTYTSTNATLNDWGEKVCDNATLSLVEGELVIALSVPFNYTNSNLMIGLDQTSYTTSEEVSSKWYGISESVDFTSANYYYSGYAWRTDGTKFSPKVMISTVAISATIGSTGYTTFTSDQPIDLSALPEGLTAYYVISDGVKSDVVSLKKVNEAVKAGTGLILVGAANTYYIPVATTEGTDLSSTNKLIGCTSETVLSSNAEYYVMVSSGGQAVFKSLEDKGAIIPAGKAYLDATGIGAGARLSLSFDEEEPTVTGISNVEHNTIGKTYNLYGQKVKTPTKGLYIIDGKKYIIK